jgi:hypothetical protein
LEEIEFLKHHLKCRDATHFNKFWGVVLEIGGDRATYGGTSHFWDLDFSPRFSSKASRSGFGANVAKPKPNVPKLGVMAKPKDTTT